MDRPSSKLIVWVAAVWGCGLVGAGRAVGDAPFFLGLSDLPGGSWTRPTGISADGSTVAGWGSSPAGFQAFRWTAAEGTVGLGFPSYAFGISGDGSVIVGMRSSEAFRWTQDEGMVGLGSMPGSPQPGSCANGVSADGSVIVGYAWPGAGIEAIRWTSATGIVGLGDLPGGAFHGEARAVSADGSVIVGSSYSESGCEAFRWTQASGMVGLGDLPDGAFESEAYAVSGDGSVIVGESRSASGREAYRWTGASGMVGLGDLPGGEFESIAYSVSTDGATIVGHSGTSSEDCAFYWTQAAGMRSLHDVLVTDVGLGQSIAGWTLYDAYAVSADGLTIVGTGNNPFGQNQAWIAHIPEPATLELLLFALPFLRRRRRTF